MDIGKTYKYLTRYGKIRTGNWTGRYAVEDSWYWQPVLMDNGDITDRSLVLGGPADETWSVPSLEDTCIVHLKLLGSPKIPESHGIPTEFYEMREIEKDPAMVKIYQTARESLQKEYLNPVVQTLQALEHLDQRPTKLYMPYALRRVFTDPVEGIPTHLLGVEVLSWDQAPRAEADNGLTLMMEPYLQRHWTIYQRDEMQTQTLSKDERLEERLALEAAKGSGNHRNIKKNIRS